MTRDVFRADGPRRFGYFVPKGGGYFNITVLSQVVSPEVLAEFERITQVIFHLQPIVLAWDVVERNYGELTSAARNYVDDLAAFRSGDIVPMPTLLDGMALLAQRVNNFLSSASAFLGQTETNISQTYGNTSSELAAWNKFRRNLHASSFAYRFLYELRNFGQHFSIPISKLDLEGARETPTSDLILKAEARIERDSLLSTTYDWGNRLRADIEKQEPKFALLPLCGEYADNLRAICLFALEIQRDRLLDCANYFAVVAKRLQMPPNAIPFLALGDLKPDEAPSQYTFIPIAQFEWLLLHYNKLLSEHNKA
jgi:hypothetical protein